MYNMKDKDTILLWEAYLTEAKRKDQNGDGKNNIKDIHIARLKAAGEMEDHEDKDEDEDEETVEEGGNHTGHDACAKGEYWCEKEKKCLPEEEGVEEDDQSYFRNEPGQFEDGSAGGQDQTMLYVCSGRDGVYGVYDNEESARKCERSVGGGTIITVVPMNAAAPESEDDLPHTL